ncbi:DNA cytosine methyltransferase [Rhizobium sp. AU243]|uniref:DNA cytosine methyltransferase n=1 Tax=Rhizobium sp. AU243 TaxID=2303425 RepID=UPI0010CBE02C|nr:DNA cytosine methyltransferase [Rhizobium sp. AU243]TKV76139.1 DNA cytosine methyltransferase [Rhizobium sp. AU243]
MIVPRRRQPYPVIDVFAGPGGLGEGFASLRGEHDEAVFRGTVAIERDEFSHRTLFLRHFLHSFPDGEFPDEYYSYLRDDITLDELYRKYKPEFAEAKKSALQISLGPESHANVQQTISQRIADRKRWVLVGGPPCQAYSLVGRSRMMGNPAFESDERHFLYREYLKIIIDHEPPVFVMENVKGLLSATVGEAPVIDRIIADLSHPRAALEGGSNGLSYNLYSLSEPDKPGDKVDPRLFLVKAEEFGVPQARHRMFIVGIRSDLKVRPGLLRSHKAPTVRETIGNLPAIRSGLSREMDSTDRWYEEIERLSSIDIASQLNGAPYNRAVTSDIKLRFRSGGDPPDKRFSRLYPGRAAGRNRVLGSLHDTRLKVLTGHESRNHMASDLRRYMYAAVFASVTGRSPKLSDFPRALLPAHQNVELGRSGKMFSDRFRVQLPDEVSTTITSHISKDGHYFIHYDPAQCRSLTVREAARLQTFPDNYSFQGPRTAQYHQVGNAVPPYLARQIAELVAEVLDAIKGGA